MTAQIQDPLVRLPPPPGAWTKRAACHGLWDVLDPPTGRRSAYNARTAIALCRSCPVIADCRAWVIGLPPSADPGGVTGGWTEYQRGLERSKRRRARQKAAR